MPEKKRTLAFRGISKLKLELVEDQGCQMVVFKPKIPIWVNLEGPKMENVCIFYDHLEYFTTIWYN
jgi:hypothetical protein